MIEVDAALLRDLLRAVIPAMGVDVNLPKWMQVRIHVENGSLSLTAADGARVHHVRADGQSMVMQTELVPGASVDTMLHACVEAAKRGRSRCDDTGTRAVVLHQGQLTTRHGSFVLGQSNTPFPNFEHVLQNMVSAGSVAEISHATQHLCDATEAATYIAPSCTLSFGENRSGSSRVTRVTAIGDDKKGVRRQLICMISASRQ